MHLRTPYSGRGCGTRGLSGVKVIHLNVLGMHEMSSFKLGHMARQNLLLVYCE
jgi:hypothetical protein